MYESGSNLYMHYVNLNQTVESIEIKKSTAYTQETIATFFSDFYAQFPEQDIPCSGFLAKTTLGQLFHKTQLRHVFSLLPQTISIMFSPEVTYQIL